MSHVRDVNRDFRVTRVVENIQSGDLVGAALTIMENEEIGIKPVNWQLNVSNASIPIKKRRFPFLPQQSTKTETSLQEEIEPPQKLHSNCQRESCVSFAKVQANSNALMGSQKTSFPDSHTVCFKNKNYKDDSDLSKVKLQEPNLNVTASRSLFDSMDIKEKLISDEISGRQISKGYNDLRCPCSESLTQLVGKDMLTKTNIEEDCKSKLFEGSAVTELFLGLKESIAPASEIQESGGSSVMSERLDCFPLNSCLRIAQTDSLCVCGEAELNKGCANVRANRSNWDLNTKEDTWAGSENIVASCRRDVSLGGLKGSFRMHEVKPSICSTGVMFKQSLEENDHILAKHISTPLKQQCMPDESLNLRLSSSCLRSDGRECSGSSNKVEPKSKLPVVMDNLNKGGFRDLKPEPLDGFTDTFNAEQVILSKSIDCSNIRAGSVENLSWGAPQKLNECSRSIKSEPVHESSQIVYKTTDGTSHQPVGQIEKSFDASCVQQMPIQYSLMHSTSPDLHLSGHIEITTHSRDLRHYEKSLSACARVESLNSEMSSKAISHDIKSNVIKSRMDSGKTVDVSVSETEDFKLKLMVGPPIDSHGNGEESATDEEKVNISSEILDDDSYDYDSGDSLALNTVNTENKLCGGEYEYEDGEVREPLKHIETEDAVCEEKVTVDVNRDDYCSRQTVLLGSPSDVHAVAYQIETVDLKIVDTCCDSNTEHIKEFSAEVFDEKTQTSDKEVSLQKFTVGIDGRQSHNHNHCDVEFSTDQITITHPLKQKVVSECGDETIKTINTVNQNDSTKPGVSTMGSDTTKDFYNNGVHRSRIINLPRPGNMLYKTRSISGSPFQSQNGRERFNDSRGSRDELCDDSPHKNVRHRNLDQRFRNPRFNTVRDRGRGSGKSDTLRGDWDPDHDFSSEHYISSTNFRFRRHKYGPGVANMELECDSYNVSRQNFSIDAGRGAWKQPINNELTSSRRRSVGREAQDSRGVHKKPQNFSPGKCIAEDGSGIIGLRRSENLMRGLENDDMDPMLARSRLSYEDDGHFMRRNRRKGGFERIRSRSPVGSKTQFNIPWRRSPDGFNRPHPEQIRRRSPGMYRMRSPDRHCYPVNMVYRRRRSPHDDMRDLDSVRNNNPRHRRSMMFNRSPSTRFLPRNNRTFDTINSRERTDDGDYFGLPVRSFQSPPYSNAQCENYNFEQGVCRQFRFPIQEGDPNFDGRDFERQKKNRIGNVSRGMRNIQGEEENYRHDGEVWHGDMFDDSPRMKRRF